MLFYSSFITGSYEVINLTIMKALDKIMIQAGVPFFTEIRLLTRSGEYICYAGELKQKQPGGLLKKEVNVK